MPSGKERERGKRRAMETFGLVMNKKKKNSR
jgi:hypothetical protein